MGRSSEGVGHQFLNPWQGVGRSIFSYPLGVGHHFFMAMGTNLTQLTTEVILSKQLKQVTHSNTNKWSGMRHSRITRAVAAMDSCFCLIWPHQV